MLVIFFTAILQAAMKRQQLKGMSAATAKVWLALQSSPADGLDIV